LLVVPFGGGVGVVFFRLPVLDDPFVGAVICICFVFVFLPVRRSICFMGYARQIPVGVFTIEGDETVRLIDFAGDAVYPRMRKKKAIQ